MISCSELLAHKDIPVEPEEPDVDFNQILVSDWLTVRQSVASALSIPTK